MEKRNRIRLSNKEALQLGFEPRPKYADGGNAKYDIDSIEKRILIIGDTHLPFEKEGYLEFCKQTYIKYDLNQVIFIGDILDNHYASFHETDADGMGGGAELDLVIEKLKPWRDAFPVADVMIGNHDLIIMRKAQTSSVPKAWIKDFKDVLDVPDWNFTDSIIYDNVFYHHGIGSKAHIKAKNNMQSTVGGHWHTDCYVQWFVGANSRIFAMQVGCGIDNTAYAMAYGKWFKKPAIACGVILGGHTAINELMKL